MAPNIAGPQIFDDAHRAPARSSVFRAIMSKPHKRNQSADDAMPPQFKNNKPTGTVPFPWVDKHAPEPGHLPLGEIVPNRDARDTYVPVSKPANKENKAPLHKKTKSAVSLKSLRSYMERKDTKSEETQIDDVDELKPKKTKSTNSLSAILKRSQRGRKADGTKQSRDKENRSPVDLVDNMPSPVWPQEGSVFQAPSSRSRQNSTADRRRSVAEEVSLYTPKVYSPAQQRNFCDYQQPSLTRQGESKPRPKSDCLAGNRKMKDILGLQHAPSGSSNASYRVDSASSKGQALERARIISVPESPVPASKEQPSVKRLSRVQAAISVFNGKERDADVRKRLSSKDLESEFEKLLVGLPRVNCSRIDMTNTTAGCPEHSS
jgi:hypothetical protein